MPLSSFLEKGAFFVRILKIVVSIICLGTMWVPVGSAAYERIVSLSPAITEIIYALDAQDTLVGVSSYCDYPLVAKEKEDVGGFINPNIERIVLLKPDMVVLSPNSGTKTIQERLDRLGINNTVVSFYTIETLQESFIEIGSLVGREESAAQLRGQLSQTIARIETAVAAEDKPRVLFVREHMPLYVAGQGTFEDDVITIAGGINCVTSKSRYPQYTIESVIALDPEIIIDATYYDTPTKDQYSSLRSFWQRLKMATAVKNKQVYIIKTDIHSVPGPRTDALLEVVAGIVHPSSWAEKSELSENVLGEE